MKIQTEKKGKQAFRYEKSIQNSTCCPGKANYMSQESYCKCGFAQLKNSYEVNP